MNTNITIKSLTIRLSILTLLFLAVQQVAWAGKITYQATCLNATTSYMGGEYRNLVDGDKNTQWCCKVKESPSVEFESSEPIIPLGYVMTTGLELKSHPEYNPTGWIIDAKVNKNDAEWTTLVSVSGYNGLPPLISIDCPFRIDNVTTAYKYFRLTINGGNDTFWGQAELSEFAFITSQDLTDFTLATVSGIHPYYKYTGSNIALDYTVKDIFGDALSATAYTPSLSLNGQPVSAVKAKGTYILTLTGADPYSGTITETFTVGDGDPVDLSTITSDYTAQNGDYLTGVLNENVKISIADGATVTLFNMTIDGADKESYSWAALNCVGNATILLEGSNYVKGFYRRYPAIIVPKDKTLTIKGTGSLYATTNGYAACIGGACDGACGNIVIEGGDITAFNKSQAAIGSGPDGSCGNITICGGNVVATAGYGGAAIGGSERSSCGDITISDGTLRATKGDGAPYSIGAGLDGSCGTVTIGGVVTGGTPSRLYVFPLPVYSGTIDLSKLTESGEILDKSILTGKLGVECQLVLVDGATVTLNNATIEGTNNEECKWAALNCKGDATVILQGSNSLKGFDKRYPAIHIPVGHTLTIKGTGSLVARNNGDGAGIGGGYGVDCGNIVIQGGTIDAEGNGSAGIGGSTWSDCGNITITGGTIRAVSNSDAAAIGGGREAACGNVTITTGVDMLFAAVGFESTCCIGPGYKGTCGTVNVGGVVGPVNQKRCYFPKRELTGVVDISQLPFGGELQDGATITGTLPTGSKQYYCIADGATVTIRDVTITGVDDLACQWAGLTCLGNATVILEGTNFLKGFYSHYPGIDVPVDKTLTIKGTGILRARNNGYASGIGGGHYIDCGNIVIEGGYIDAEGTTWSAGIGTGHSGKCGSITITDGVIGVIATKVGSSVPYSVGGGTNGSCGTVTIGGVVTGPVADKTFTYIPPSTSIYTATGGTTGANNNESYSKLVDGSYATKWCVNSLGSPTYIEFETADAIIPIGYTMITGNDTKDNPTRNPKSWVVKAKANSGDSWTTIATVENDTNLPAASFASCTYAIENTDEKEYKYFRLEISAIQSGSVFQLSEFSFVVQPPKECHYTLDTPQKVTIMPNAEWTTVTVDVSELEFYNRPYGRTPKGLRVVLQNNNTPSLVNQADENIKIPYKMNRDGSTSLFTQRVYDVSTTGSLLLYLYISPNDWNAAPPGTYEGSLQCFTMWRFQDSPYLTDYIEDFNIPVTVTIPEGVTTNIEKGQRDSLNGQRDEWYSLDGRRLNGKPSKKGVYIQNGKRVVVK